MAVEKKFVKDGFVKASMDEYFALELGRSGYGGMNINRTPMGTQITVFSEKPGMVIGKSGKIIRKLTRDVELNYHIDNPQIDAQEVKQPELNAQIMANKLASSIERGWYFRKAGTNTLKAIMSAGALGCEIVISGKLTGARSRVEKFIDGYIKHAGYPASEIVNKGYAVAIKKLGTLGCKVKIIPPGSILPDSFSVINNNPKEKVISTDDIIENENTNSELNKPESEDIVQQNENINEEHSVDNNDNNSESTTNEIIKDNVSDQIISDNINNENSDVDKIIVVENSEINEIKRIVDGIWQHKHDGYDYWHPVSRIHKEVKYNVKV